MQSCEEYTNADIIQKMIFADAEYLLENILCAKHIKADPSRDLIIRQDFTWPAPTTLLTIKIPFLKPTAFIRFVNNYVSNMPRVNDAMEITVLAEVDGRVVAHHRHNLGWPMKSRSCIVVYYR